MLVNQVDVSFDNVRELLDLSQHKLVIFDFWAEGYEPSAQLTAILATITGEYPEHLVLARVNCSVEQQLAMQFGGGGHRGASGGNYKGKSVDFAKEIMKKMGKDSSI